MIRSRPQERVSDRGPAGTRRRRWWIRVAVIVLLLFLGAPAVVRAYRVHGPSDAPTYLWGDLVLVNMAAYDLGVPFTRLRLVSWADPERGDFILFPIPDTDHVGFKRVVGLPGDQIEMRENVLFVNGVPLEYESRDPGHLGPIPAINWMGTVVALEHGLGEDYTVTFTPGHSADGTFGPVTVAEGHYFTLGDNRDHSRDSRHYGAVPRREILGRLALTLRRAD